MGLMCLLSHDEMDYDYNNNHDYNNNLSVSNPNGIRHGSTQGPQPT